MDSWISERERLLADDWADAASLQAVEQMIRQYDDFLATVESQGQKCDEIRRLTLVSVYLF